MSRPPELIETVRLRGGEAPLWGFHLARVIGSCTEVGVPPPRELLLAAGGPDRVVRFLVSARGVETTERPVGPSTPVRLIVSTERHEPYPHKLAARDVFDRALREAASQGADDGVLLTHGGWVAETSIWGLYWWDGDRLCAPPADFGILRSVARRRIGELADIAEVRAAPANLTGAGLFVANAARGVVPVASLGGNPVVTDPRTVALAAAFWA